MSIRTDDVRIKSLRPLISPAILVEVGYISHPDESLKLKDPAHQDAVAKAIAEGVSDFLETVGSRERAQQTR